ncbi:hypothetical protein EJB05_13996, partial [Eragrostis curvula]
MAKKKKGLVAAFKRQHFLRSADSEFFYVGFSDVYELFNFDALDVSILRCYTLSMIKEARAKSFSVGFLDPEVMTLSTICDDKSYVVDYVTRAFGKYAKKKCIMFAHNPENHWILIAIVPEWHKVLFLDSYRSSPRNHAMLKDVIDEAFLSYCSAYGMPHKKLTYVTKFPCHQQGCTQECGFYTAHHMRLALGLLNVERAEQFEVLTTSLKRPVLEDIREQISWFIMSEIVDKNGEFYCKRQSTSAVANITAPRLHFLEWSDAYRPSFVQFGNIARLRHLGNLHFLVYGDDFVCNLASLMLLQRFKVIDCLMITLLYPPEIDDYQYLMDAMTVLPEFTILHLVVIANGHAFGASSFHVLRMCTSIRKLVLKFSAHSNFEAPTACSSGCICDQSSNWKTEELIFNRLQEIQIKELRGSEHEFSFVKRLFSWATALKQVTVTFSSAVTESKMELMQMFQSISRPGICMKF